MNSAALARLLKTLSPDIIELNEDVLQSVGKRRPLRRVTPLESEPTPAPVNPRTVLEERFLRNWTLLDGCKLQREYRFDDVRRWRFDFAIPNIKVAFEIQGGLYAPQTGHRSKEGVERDMEKLNAAQLQGWQVFQISSKAMGDANFMQKLIDYCAGVM